jgi:hypothetical protein
MAGAGLSKKAYLSGHQMASANALKKLTQPPVIGDPIFGHLKPIAGGIFNCLATRSTTTNRNQLISRIF